MANLYDTYVSRQKEKANEIGNLYNQKANTEAAALQPQHAQAISNAQATQRQIAPQYQTQANNMAASYERNRRNMNLQNLNSGMGTGTAVQQQEALNRVYQNNYSGLRAQEAQAQTQAAQGLANIEAEYQNNLAKIRMQAQNDKNAATIKSNNEMWNWYEGKAKELAGYGDFSGYNNIVGEPVAKNMQEVWIIQNPEAALGAGLIDSAKYKQITGHDPGTK